MTETHNVFISWSGTRSKRAAEALKEWLPLVLHTANPWMSATDIDKGTRWSDEVAVALDTMKAGIICVTPENLREEWLLFEAGALSKTRDPKTRVWTYLLADLKTQHLKDPLRMFQATTTDKEDTRKLIHSINKNLDGTVPETRVNQLFNLTWQNLEKELVAIAAQSGATPSTRSPDEIAGESLELLRSVAPLIQDIAAETDIIRQNRLAEEAWRRSLANLPSGTNLVLSGPTWPTGWDLLKVPLSSSGSVTINTKTPSGNTEPAPTESTPSPNKPEGTFTLPSSPGRKTHAPRLRKHVSPSPKAKT